MANPEVQTTSITLHRVTTLFINGLLTLIKIIIFFSALRLVFLFEIIDHPNEILLTLTSTIFLFIILHKAKNVTQLMIRLLFNFFFNETLSSKVKTKSLYDIRPHYT